MTVSLSILKSLEIVELREQWAVAFGAPPAARLSRAALLLALGWQAQAKIEGGFNRATREQLSRLANQLKAGWDLRNPTTSPRPNPSAGTSLIREWHGTVHQVLVLEKGYRWNDRIWPSLSAIAIDITGTRWNGPAFFGLRSNKPLKQDSCK
ncbi:hypothetical protein A9Q96_00155 [Rhodobacterales bacterium 52_120_T64]|nr:hypothetical protein A9Q96_00155 [Rhodobacterales bacterium 52_120_T64]